MSQPAAAQSQDSARVNVMYWISAVHVNTYTAHILIANPTTRDVPFWSLIFDLDSEVTFLNHALWEQEGARVAVEGSGWTKRIPARDSVWFSFAVRYDSTFHEPRNCYFSAKPCRFVTEFDDPPDTGVGNGDDGGGDGTGGPVAGANVHVEFWYTSVWENGFVAWISVKNRGSTPVLGWAISFDFPQPIGIIWNGRLSVAGRRYTVRDEGWNARVNPGDSVAFGFQGTYAGLPRTPSSCVFNGGDCTFNNRFGVNNALSATSAETSVIDGFTLNVAPNPAPAATRLDIGVDRAQHVSVELVDVQGRILSMLFDGYMTAGNRRWVHADLSGVPSGVYVMRMRGTAGLIAHRPVVVVR